MLIIRTVLCLVGFLWGALHAVGKAVESGK